VRIRLRVAHVLAGVAGVAFTALAVALVAQYEFDMQPCPWCVLQRLICIVVGVLAAVGAVSGGIVRRAAVGLATLGSLAGAAAALWQQFFAASENSCDISLAGRIVSGWLRLDRLSDIFVAYASCGDAAVSVLGVPFAIWSCLQFLMLAGLSAWSLRAALRSGR